MILLVVIFDGTVCQYLCQVSDHLKGMGDYSTLPMLDLVGAVCVVDLSVVGGLNRL